MMNICLQLDVSVSGIVAEYKQAQDLRWAGKYSDLRHTDTSWVYEGMENLYNLRASVVSVLMIATSQRPWYTFAILGTWRNWQTRNT